MVEEGIPTYFVGDTVCVAARIEVGPDEGGLRRVAARFAHEADPSAEIELSDEPASWFDCQVQQPGATELAGRIVDGVHPPGVYRCRAMTVTYVLGGVVHFSSVPDIRFRVAARSPEVLDWWWPRQQGSTGA